MISANRNLGALKGIKPSFGSLGFSHQQFMDDIIMGGEAMVLEDTTIKKVLSSYTKGTWQLINWNKLSIFFINTLAKRQMKMTSVLDVALVSFVYLFGAPYGPQTP